MPNGKAMLSAKRNPALTGQRQTSATEVKQEESTTR